MLQKIGDWRELDLRWINDCTLSIDPPILNFIVVNNHLINKYERCPLKKKKNWVLGWITVAFGSHNNFNRKKLINAQIHRVKGFKIVLANIFLFSDHQKACPNVEQKNISYFLENGEWDNK